MTRCAYRRPVFLPRKERSKHLHEVPTMYPRVHPPEVGTFFFFFFFRGRTAVASSSVDDLPPRPVCVARYITLDQLVGLIIRGALESQSAPPLLFLRLLAMPVSVSVNLVGSNLVPEHPRALRTHCPKAPQSHLLSCFLGHPLSAELSFHHDLNGEEANIRWPMINR